MIIIEDTRNQIGKHKNINDYFYGRGVKVYRNKLPLGDYALMTDLSKIVDTKKDMLEICSNICGEDHERFRNECMLAQEMNVSLMFLIEDEEVKSLEEVMNWKSPLHKYGKNKGKPYTQVKGETLYKAMKTISEKYGVKFMFCNKKQSGKIILDFLRG